MSALVPGLNLLFSKTKVHNEGTYDTSVISLIQVNLFRPFNVKNLHLILDSVPLSVNVCVN